MELRIGVIGTGGIGRTHIERINTKLQGGRVIAAADDNADFGMSVAEQYGVKGYADPADLIKADDIDAVVICTADATHFKHTLAAIEAGKYVFVEKPLAPSQEECKKLVDAEVAGGKQLVQVGYMRRYDPGYAQLKEAIDSKKIGEPLMLHCAHRNPEVPGTVAWDNSMAVENSLVHEIDVLRWLLGEDYETAEVAFTKKSKNAGEYQDPQILILTTKSGVRIDVESFVNCRYGYDIQCEVVGEEGTINLPEPNNAMIRTNASRVYPICDSWSQRFVDAYNIEFQAWINASLEGKVDGPTAWDGYVAQVTAATASKAREAQKVMKIEMDECPDFYKK